MKKTHFLFLMLFMAICSLSAQTTVTYNLTAWTTVQHPLWDGNSMVYYGFGPGFLVAPTFPAPTLYANEGDTMIIEVRNQSQGPPHTIHWHGLDVDQYNDGVPNLSWVIPHLADSSYTFVATHAGTYLYHCHVASIVHVNMGMYGNVIVRPADGSDRAFTGGPAFDKQYNWLVSETDKSWHDNIPVHHTGDSLHEIFAIPPYEPDYFFVNGLSRQDLSDSTIQIQGKVGEKIFLRLSNVGFLLNEIILPASLNASVIMSDGRALPVSLSQDTLEVAPGERYGLMLSPSQEINTQIDINYRSMDSRDLISRESPPVIINGFIGREKPASTIDWAVWPSPADEVLNYKAEGTDLEIFSASGALVFRSNIEGKDVGSLDISGLSKGVYTIRLSTKSGERTGRTFLKK